MVKGKKKAAAKANVLNGSVGDKFIKKDFSHANRNKEDGSIVKYLIEKPIKQVMQEHKIDSTECLLVNAEYDLLNSENNAFHPKIKKENVETSLTYSEVNEFNDTKKENAVQPACISKLVISPKTEEIVHEANKGLGKTTRRKIEVCSQLQLTDFYKIRRSNRKTRSKVLKEKEKLVEERIISGVEEGLEVINIVGKGRGVVTTKEFKRGEFVVEYSGELIDNAVAKKRELEYAKDTNTGCYMYYFLHNCQKYCVDATEETGRYGRLINHSSKTGNLSTKSFIIDGVPHLIFVANRDILPNEELLYDYGDRRKESLEAHPWLAT